jgi:hypothetical protein
MGISAARRPAVFDLVVMIGSVGGVESGAVALSGLPGDFPVPVVFCSMAARAPDPSR